MASLGKQIIIGLSDRMNQRREFLAEQRARAQDNLRSIEASRRTTVGRAREALQQNVDYLITRGLREDEVSQLLESDPREVIRLGTRLANDTDLTADDIRTAAQFREDYAQETPLSELIRAATPIFRDVDEPDPAARQQNIFQRLFSLDTQADMDRFYRESNFGGFSGYDVLASVEASPYRERTGEPVVDYGRIPVAVTATQLNTYRDGVEDVLKGIANSIDLDRDLPDELSMMFRDIKDVPNAIQRLLFDESDPERYEALRPYREQLLEELLPYYEQTPRTFDTPTFGNLGSIVADYAQSLTEEVVAGEEPNTLTITGRPEGEQEVAAMLERLRSGDFTSVTITNPETGESRVGTVEEAIAWITGPSGDGDDGGDVIEPPAETGTGTEFRRDLDEALSTRNVDVLISRAKVGLATGEYGPGSAPIRRFYRYLFESDREVLDEAEAIRVAADLLDDKEEQIRRIITTDPEARQLFEEDPLRFLEEYADQLNGE